MIDRVAAREDTCPPCHCERSEAISPLAEGDCHVALRAPRNDSRNVFPRLRSGNQGGDKLTEDMRPGRMKRPAPRLLG
jgi:hypothetical protein